MTIIFPIYNNDFSLSLSETVLYLKEFPHVMIKKGVKHELKCPTFVTDHYFIHGLIIRLFWMRKKDSYEGLPEDIYSLLSLHAKGLVSLQGCVVRSFSSKIFSKIPSDKEKRLFHDKVLKKGNHKMYTKEKYKKLEYDNIVLKYSDDFYDEIREKN